MQTMPRPRPPHLHREINRHGTAVWYVRVGKGPRIRLRAEFGTPEFQAAYQDAVAGKIKPKENGPVSGTIAWYVARYRDSSAWLSLSLATRRQRENILRQVLSTAGTEPLARIDRKAIIAGRERRAITPFQARHFLDTMRGFFQWALENEHVKSDPTEGVKISKPKTDGFPAWTDDEIEQYERRWPRGTRERVMFDIFLYTGLRRGDAAQLGKQHVRAGIITINTEKTGTRVEIPMLPELARTLKAGPIGDLAYIATADGRPMSKEVVGNLFRQACRKAGIEKSAHGLRKSAATRAADRGATVAQLEAIFGWEGGRMASHYTKGANHKALAAAAMSKLSRQKGK
jgi:integrase